MNGKPKEPAFLPRDGTSQKGRALAALDPASARVDERTARDLVAFAREVGAGLVYYGPDDRRRDEAPAWDKFVGDLPPELVAAFLEAPERFDPKATPALFRPHFSLFLAFLKLFQGAQEELNALTRRHLDFYYRRVLCMGKKGPTADRVHLLFDLARGEREVLVAEGSLVSAGPDALGREQVYRTERPLVVNRASLARKSAVFVERRVTGFAEARAARPAGQWLLEMLRLALGEPRPGGALPASPALGEITPPKLDALDALGRLTSEGAGFYLSLAELRDLMRRREVVAKLEQTPGADPAPIAEQWGKINDALRLAGRRKRKSDTYLLPGEGTAAFDPKKFADNAADAVGAVTVGGESYGLEAYWGAVAALEAYFYMSAERFHEVVSRAAQLAAQGAKPDDVAWYHVDAILEGAYQAKVRDGRIRRLRAIHQANTAQDELGPLIREALGDATATEDDLAPFLTPAQLTSLREAYQKQERDWGAIYGLLELAQRNRLGERPPQKEEWLNLHPAADAGVAGARPAGEGQTGPARWATFGLAPKATPGAPPPPALGLAISSPLLWLREGSRTLTLTLALRGDEIDEAKLKALFGAEPSPLTFQVSTAKGWVECAADVKVDSYAALSGAAPPAGNAPGVQFVIELGAAVDPIEPLSPKLAATPGAGPALRLMLRPIFRQSEGRYVVGYQEFASLALAAAHLKVTVGGLRAERLQNDDRALDPKKPFEPFGGAPAVGSRLLIGHREISSKAIEGAEFTLVWMGDPADLGAHYANYRLDGGPPLVDPKALGVQISLVERGQQAWSGDESLVGSDAAALVTWIEAPNVRAEKGAGPEAAPPAALGDDPSTWGRYLQWELTGSNFGHAAYPAVASGKALELAVAVAKNEVGEAASYKVNPPYTPKLKSLTIGYVASHELRPDEAAGAGLRVLHVHPFGQCDARVDGGAEAGGVPFLPRYDNDGELYLGLADVAPPQSVSLLFQLAEGSADPDLLPQPIAWSYLDGDRWVPFAHRLLRDSTGGLVSSGVVELALEPVAPSDRLAGGLYWVRAAVARGVASVCDTIDIHPQATSAVFVDRGNAPEHYREPLAPSSIKKLSARIPGVAGVRQPYTSTGGRAAEDEGAWATRVSERLRHKQRALTMWDYERLVLEHFPQVYKARCLPARPDAPGRVELVVIPDIRHLLPSDPFEPKAPSSLLAAIEAFLRDQAPAFAEVRARNARYLPVRVRLAVRFKGEGNDSFYRHKLNDELNRFLSPWAFEEGSDIALGGRIYANSITDFVDRRDYVDYVAGVRLFRSDDGGATYRPAPAPPEGEGDFVAVDRPDTALVAARTHEIIVLRDTFYDEASMSGINFMKIELDFIVT